MDHGDGFNTRAVHAGEIMDDRFGNVVTPIFETATFMSPNRSADPYIDSSRGEPFLYTRWGNPTTQSLESKYASLEGVKFGLAFSSGMAAISSAVFALCNRGDRILSINELYGQTHSFFSSYLERFGIGCDFIGIDQANSLSFNPERHALFYLESIINPTLKVADLEKIGNFCRENNIPLLVDATFASPYNQNPSKFGAAVVLHSGTKYISGHSDVTLGLAGTDSMDVFGRLLAVRRTTGPVTDPLQSYLAARGMKTIGLRVEKQNRVAMDLAKFLNQHKKVVHVYYPGLDESPYHAIASRVLRGYGGMVSFEVAGGLNGARKFMASLKIPAVAASLGGVESLVTLPVETSHSSIPAEGRKAMGIEDGLVRFSCGIEDSQDLINDIDNALALL
ncbi:MAG: aminotransferase class I/II-fold pyridoxal phosphate-dependent enzyme [Thermoplasmataceae archaeon]